MSSLRPLGLLVLRDLRRLLAARASFIQRTVFLGVAALPLALMLDEAPNPATLAWSSRMQMSVTRGWTLFGLYLVTPALGASAIRLDKEEASLDVLRASGFNERSIVWAAVLANTLLVAFVAASLFPILGVGFVFGGVVPLDLLTLGVSVLSVALFGVSIGVLFGSYAPSGLAAYGRSFMLVYLPLGMLSVLSLGALASGTLPSTLAGLASPLMGPGMLPTVVAGGMGLGSLDTVVACAVVAGSSLLVAAAALEAAASVLARTGTREARGIGLETTARRVRAAARRFGAEVRGNPVAWRERRRVGLYRWHVPTLLLVVVSAALQLGLEVGAAWERSLEPGVYSPYGFGGFVEAVPILFVMAALGAAGLTGLHSVLSERRNGSFEILALTPVSGLSQVGAKLVASLLPLVLVLGPTWGLHQGVRLIVEPEASLAATVFCALSLTAGMALLAMIGQVCSLLSRSLIGALFSFAGIVVGTVVLAYLYVNGFARAFDQIPTSLGGALTSPFAGVVLALGLSSMPEWMEHALGSSRGTGGLLLLAQGLVVMGSVTVLLLTAAAGPIRRRVLAQGEARAR